MIQKYIFILHIILFVFFVVVVIIKAKLKTTTTQLSPGTQCTPFLGLQLSLSQVKGVKGLTGSLGFILLYKAQRLIFLVYSS